jgi:hypothetical protein
MSSRGDSLPQWEHGGVPISVEEIRRVRAEGESAAVGEPNPYYGQLVLAAVWRHGYTAMMCRMIEELPSRQAFLRAQRAEPLANPPLTRCGRDSRGVPYCPNCMRE